MHNPRYISINNLKQIRPKPNNKSLLLKTKSKNINTIQPVRPIKANIKSVAAISNKKQIQVAKRTRQIPNTRERALNINKANIKQLRTTKRSKTAQNAEFGPNIDKIRDSGEGKILIIVGNGPSHAEAKLEKLLKNPYIDIMSINKPDSRLWPTDYWLFCDNSQYRRHKLLWNGYGGTIINTGSIKNIKPNTVRVISKQGKGFSRNLHNGMYIGRSSVYAALQVAIWMNYDHIYVFGCDMTSVNGKLYPWGSNPDVNDVSREKRFQVEATFYNWMGNNLDQNTKNKITFCSKYNPWPFIKKFEKLDHITAVSEILKRHKGNKNESQRQ